MLNNYRTLRIAGFAAAAAAFAAQPTLAADTSGTMSVTASVAASCAVSTTAVAFGTVDTTSATPDDAAGTLLVTCTSGTGWTATADAGGTTGATRAARKMLSGSDELTYSLFTDSGRTIIWGDTAALDGASILGTGTGAQQSTPIYGRVPGSQNSVPVGSYSDSVAVTLTY